jgi:hypothetical protein
MDLREIGLGGCGLDSTGSGQGPVAGCCKCSDEPSGSCATELDERKCLRTHITLIIRAVKEITMIWLHGSDKGKTFWKVTLWKIIIIIIIIIQKH